MESDGLDFTITAFDLQSGHYAMISFKLKFYEIEVEGTGTRRVPTLRYELEDI